MPLFNPDKSAVLELPNRQINNTSRPVLFLIMPINHAKIFRLLEWMLFLDLVFCSSYSALGNFYERIS